MPIHDDWFRSHAHEFSGGGLWLSGAEPNRLPASEWETRRFRVLLSRLSTWKDTLESFTHRVLYGMLRDIDGVFPDLAWVPGEHDGRILSEAGVPWLLGSGTRRDAYAAFFNAPLLLDYLSDGIYPGGKGLLVAADPPTWDLAHAALFTP